MRDKHGISFKDTEIDGNRISSLDKDFLQRLNDGILEHPLQIGELVKILTARELIRKNKLQRVVEIGCGSGIVEKFLRRYIQFYLGIDVDQDRISEKINDKKTSWKVLDVTKEKIPCEWDLLLAFDVVEHFSSKEVGLEWLRHVGDCLKKNSYAIVCTPIVTEEMSKENIRWYPDYHNYEFSLKELIEETTIGGLQLIGNYGLHYEKQEFEKIKPYNQLEKIIGWELASSIEGLFLPSEKAKVQMFILKKDK